MGGRKRGGRGGQGREGAPGRWRGKGQKQQKKTGKMKGGRAGGWEMNGVVPNQNPLLIMKAPSN